MDTCIYYKLTYEPKEIINRRNGNFQLVVSLLYAHYHILFYFYHAYIIALLYQVHKKNKKKLDGFYTFVNSVFTSFPCYGGMVVQRFVKL